MATQTSFDLNTAIKRWKEALAAQPQLTADERRELEKHLDDGIAELRQRGLNEEESFWLAQRRMGSLQQLVEEFEKADPAKVWRERIFWMAAALVGSYLFMTWKDLLATWVNESAWVEILYLLPVGMFIGAVIMVRWKPLQIPSASVPRKYGWLLLGLLTVTVLTAYFRGRHLPNDNLISAGYDIGLVLSWLGDAVCPALMVLVVLLTYTHGRKNHQPV